VLGRNLGFLVGNGCCGEREGLARRDMSRWFITCRDGPFSSMGVSGMFFLFGINNVFREEKRN
jgi:hypothetical protein